MRFVLLSFALVMTLFAYENVFKTRLVPRAVVPYLSYIQNVMSYGMLSIVDVVVHGLLLDYIVQRRGPVVLGLALWLATLFPPKNVLNLILQAFSTNGPFVANTNFQGAAVLEASYATIRDEVRAMLAKTTLACFKDQLSLVTTLQRASSPCWKWLTLIDHHGVNPEAHTLMPRTLEMLRAMPDVVTASISVLEPRTELLPHRGYYKGILRYHLGLVVPPRGAHLVCGGERYDWVEGEGVMFDDTFIHSAHNPTDERRVVLFVDVLRKDLPAPLAWVNAVVVRLLMGAITAADRNTHASVKRVR
jgi:beta-hydroxylase